MAGIDIKKNSGLLVCSDLMFLFLHFFVCLVLIFFKDRDSEVVIWMII